ncbi:MAG: hypothetical protein ABFE13_27005 [Phycisphaerales bacterium]
MVRTNPLIIGAVALLAVAAQAGEIKTHTWISSPVPQELATIPVWMEIQPWVRIKDLDKLVIRLIRQSTTTYEGCIDLVCEARANVNISAEFMSNGLIPGEYSCRLSSPYLDAPGGTLSVCVKLKTQALPPPTNVRVGTVIFRITPRA